MNQLIHSLDEWVIADSAKEWFAHSTCLSFAICHCLDTGNCPCPQVIYGLVGGHGKSDRRKGYDSWKLLEEVAFELDLGKLGCPTMQKESLSYKGTHVSKGMNPRHSLG